MVVLDPKDAKLKAMAEEIDALKRLIEEQRDAFDAASSAADARAAKVRRIWPVGYT